MTYKDVPRPLRPVRWLWSRMWDYLPCWTWLVRIAECFPESWSDQADVSEDRVNRFLGYRLDANGGVDDHIF